MSAGRIRLAYTVPDAAAATGVAETDLRSAIVEGGLAAQFIGRRLIIRAADLDAWLAGRRSA